MSPCVMGLPSCTGSAGDLIPQAKKYKQEHGCYREGICADRIYIITKNRNFCTRSNIRLSAMRLGRPPKDPEVNAVGVPSSGVIPPVPQPGYAGVGRAPQAIGSKAGVARGGQPVSLVIWRPRWRNASPRPLRSCMRPRRACWRSATSLRSTSAKSGAPT